MEKHTRDTNALNTAIPGVENFSDEDMLEIELSEKPFPVYIKIKDSVSTIPTSEKVVHERSMSEYSLTPAMWFHR